MVENRIALANAVAAAHLVAGLVEGGVRHLVLSPGYRNAPIALAFANRTDARLHVVLDERTAAFFALGLARASGEPVALSCTSGTAGTHYLPAIVEAHMDGVPLVALTADRPAELHRCGAVQTVDQIGLFGPHVVSRRNLCAPTSDVSPRVWRTAAWQAVGEATRGGEGPVHLNVPFREPVWEPQLPSDLSPRKVLAPVIAAAPALPDPREVGALAARLAHARRGVIVCGPGRGAPRGAVTALAKALGWPVLAEAASGVRFGPPDGSLLVTAYDSVLRTGEMPDADLVLQLGRSTHCKALAAWLDRADQRILVDPDGRRHDPGHRAETLVEADAGRLCTALNGHMEGQIREIEPSWTSRWRSVEEVARGVLDRACDDGLWEGAIARHALMALPDDAAVHVASSMPIRDVDAFVPALGTRLEVFANRGVNGIDGTISTAVGEAGAIGDAPMLLLLGDLAFLHDLGGLLLLSQQRPNLTVVVVNNGGGGIFGFLPVAEHGPAFERCFVTPQSVDISGICEGFRLPHRRVTDRADLDPALSDAIHGTGPMVIEAIVDRDDNISRHHAAWAEVAHRLKEERT